MKRKILKLLFLGGICILLNDAYIILIKKASFTMFGFITFILVGLGLVYIAGELEDNNL